MTNLTDRVKQIEKLYHKAEMTDDRDEKGAGGFWDLAGEIAYGLSNDDDDREVLQDKLYIAIKDTLIN